MYYMRFTLLLIFFFFITVCGYAQSTVSNTDEYYFRVLQITGITDDVSSFQLRPYDIPEQTDHYHPWRKLFEPVNDGLQINNRYATFQFYEPILFQSYNSALPRGNNDGAIWQGRGYNSAFSTGFRGAVGPLHIQFRPVIGVAQNLSYDLGPYLIPTIRTSEGRVEGNEFMYRDFRGSIDYVQRYGDSSYTWADLGESSVELKYAGLRLALSNKKIWTGPAVNTSLHFGYSAPGFKHLFLGTYKPLQTAAGNFEFAYIFGKTRESDYFTENRILDSQSVNALVFIYTPWFTNNFSIGGVRTYFHPFPESFSQYRIQARKLFEPGLREALTDEDGEPRGFDPDNQLASVFFRYIIPENGFEVYGEYGRNDHNANWRDFRAQPNHHRAYTIGATKSLWLPGNRLMAINIELNQFEAMRTALTRGGRHLGGWYTHSRQVLGFTNNGQILGTGYGPGVNMQKIRADLFDERGGLSFKVARIAYHNSRMDQYFNSIQNANEQDIERWEVRNIEIMLGTGLTAFLPHNFELTATIEQSIILNQHYLKENDLANTRVEVVLRKQLRGWVR